MSVCSKCLENKWNYEYLEGYIIATCEFCGNQVEFMSRKLKKKYVKFRRNQTFNSF